MDPTWVFIRAVRLCLLLVGFVCCTFYVWPKPVCFWLCSRTPPLHTENATSLPLFCCPCRGHSSSGATCSHCKSVSGLGSLGGANRLAVRRAGQAAAAAALFAPDFTLPALVLNSGETRVKRADNGKRVSVYLLHSCWFNQLYHKCSFFILLSTCLYITFHSLTLQLSLNTYSIDINAKTVTITEQSLTSYPGAAPLTKPTGVFTRWWTCLTGIISCYVLHVWKIKCPHSSISLRASSVWKISLVIKVQIKIERDKIERINILLCH